MVGGCEVHAYLYVNGGVGEGGGDEGGGLCKGGSWLGKGQSFSVVGEDTELRGWIVDMVAFGLGKGWG